MVTRINGSTHFARDTPRSEIGMRVMHAVMSFDVPVCVAKSAGDPTAAVLQTYATISRPSSPSLTQSPPRRPIRSRGDARRLRTCLFAVRSFALLVHNIAFEQFRMLAVNRTHSTPFPAICLGQGAIAGTCACLVTVSCGSSCVAGTGPGGLLVTCPGG